MPDPFCQIHEDCAYPAGHAGPCRNSHGADLSWRARVRADRDGPQDAIAKANAEYRQWLIDNDYESSTPEPRHE